MVFYRKYRPQKIKDLDSKDVRETLASILSTNPPHALLFTGPKGLGKTSAARIIAKAVNCTAKNNDKNIEPCNKCESCKSITEGVNMDILEIDAASNRGIDEIRDLKEKIRLSPLSAKIKVYIIDEVHMLTSEAFNALLKTLEEPPSHAMFILCTTEPQKLPETIVSRCFHINFNLATTDEIVHSLKRIVESEKIKIDDDSLTSIAQMADGGFRDAAKILEEVTLITSGKITKEVLEKSYKTKSIPLHIANLLATFKMQSREDAVKEGLRIVEDIVSQGVDIKFFVSQILTDLNKRLLQEVGIEKREEKSSENLQFTIKELGTVASLFNQVYQETKNSVVPQLPLELAIIEYSMSQNYAEPDAEQRIDSNQSESQFKSANISDLRKQDGNIKKIKAMYGSANLPAGRQGMTSEEKKGLAKSLNQQSGNLLHTTASGAVSKEWLDTFWKSLISEVKNYNHTIAGVLRGCRIGSFDKKHLVIETDFKFHKERLSDMKTRDEFSRIAKMLTGREVTVEVQLKSR